MKRMKRMMIKYVDAEKDICRECTSAYFYTRLQYIISFYWKERCDLGYVGMQFESSMNKYSSCKNTMGCLE